MVNYSTLRPLSHRNKIWDKFGIRQWSQCEIGGWVGEENKSSIESPGLPASTNSSARSPHCAPVEPK